MKISDERREVAGLMRGEAADFRRLGEEHGDAWTVDLGDVPAIFQDITHYAGLDGVVRADAIFDRLADLIDPTCHVDVNKHGRAYCTNCGCDDWCLADGSRFCPNCGCRCTYDDVVDDAQ